MTIQPTSIESPPALNLVTLEAQIEAMRLDNAANRASIAATEAAFQKSREETSASLDYFKTTLQEANRHIETLTIENQDLRETNQKLTRLYHQALRGQQAAPAVKLFAPQNNGPQ